MKLSASAKSFCKSLHDKDEVQEAIDPLSYSERLMVSVDLQLLQDKIMQEVKEALDGCVEEEKIKACNLQ